MEIFGILLVNGIKKSEVFTHVNLLRNIHDEFMCADDEFLCADR